MAVTSERVVIAHSEIGRSCRELQWTRWISLKDVIAKDVSSYLRVAFLDRIPEKKIPPPGQVCLPLGEGLPEFPRPRGTRFHRENAATRERTDTSCT